MKKFFKILLVSIALTFIMISCASKRKAGCDAYSENSFYKETEKQSTK